ncbi:PAAR-like protein [Lacrimispora sp.]|uniref:PAAR-like protein n=1 Tax=Lacrimispora sp. TaxID=2719234 RepID=UPI0032E39502
MADNIKDYQMSDSIWKFVYPYDGKERTNQEKQQEEVIRQKQSLELMHQYQQYYGMFEQNKYVLRESVISCQYGTKYAKLDCEEDHGVYKHMKPVMAITDCANNNIHNFGSCLCPEANYVGRLPMTNEVDNMGVPAIKASQNKRAHICVPIISENSVWHQVDSNALIGVKQKGYAPMLLDNAVLVCQYGGVIYVKEVAKIGETHQIADKYYVNDRVKIRETPNGKQLDGNKVFIKGAIVKVHPSKELKKVDGSDSTWIKVFYDGSNIAWIAKEVLEELPQPVTNYKYQYNWDKSQYVTRDFKNKAAGVAKELGLDPDDLMTVMAFESGLNPAQKNMAGGSATGLVQFMPMVAEELNTTTNELSKMSGVEQLDYVFGYLYPQKGKISTLGDIYMRILCPEAIGKDSSYILYSSGTNEYTKNKGLDFNKDGKITKQEAVQRVLNIRNNYN